MIQYMRRNTYVYCILYCYNLPSQYFDFVVQRVLFALQRFFVDDLYGIHFVWTFLAHSQSDFRKSTPVNIKLVSCNFKQYKL